MGSQSGEGVVWWQQGGGSGWWNGWSHIRMWWVKIGKDTWGASNPGPSRDHVGQGSSARKIKPHKFCL